VLPMLQRVHGRAPRTAGISTAVCFGARRTTEEPFKGRQVLFRGHPLQCFELFKIGRISSNDIFHEFQSGIRFVTLYITFPQDFEL